MFLFNGLINPAKTGGGAVHNLRTGEHAARLSLVAMLGWLSLAPASTLAGDEAVARPAAREVSPPQAQPAVPPRVLFYFPFLPVPGVPPQFLPAPSSPYIWPLPVLVILPAPPTSPAPPAPAPIAAKPETPAVAAQVEAPAKPPEPVAPPVAPPVVAPAVIAPPAQSGVPPEVVVPAVAVPQKKASAETPGPVAIPASKTKAALADSKAKPAAQPAKKKPKTRKLCWKDGRLDVCK